MIVPGIYLGFALGMLVSAILFATRSVFRIEQGHVGVLMTHGRAEYADASLRLVRTWEPGLHFKWPWQKARCVSMMEQSLDLSGEEGGIITMASDGTILRLDSKLRYAPVKEELYDFLFAMREPLDHIKGLFICLLRNEIANFKSHEGDGKDIVPSGSYSVIRRERKLLNRHIEDFTRLKIGGRYGVRFDAVDLTDILPPDELAQALNAVFNAQSEADAAYSRAEGECQQRAISAEKGVSIAEARARATETEICTLAGFLADLEARKMLTHYVERRRAETTYESRAVFVKRPS